MSIFRLQTTDIDQAIVLVACNGHLGVELYNCTTPLIAKKMLKY